MFGRSLLPGMGGLVLLLGAYGCDTRDNAQTDGEVALDAGLGLIDGAAPVVRPPGWDELSHGADATVDYARIFPSDGVQRIDIRIAPEQRDEMLADLETLLGKEGDGGMREALAAPAAGP